MEMNTFLFGSIISFSWKLNFFVSWMSIKRRDISTLVEIIFDGSEKPLGIIDQTIVQYETTKNTSKHMIVK